MEREKEASRSVKGRYALIEPEDHETEPFYKQGNISFKIRLAIELALILLLSTLIFFLFLHENQAQHLGKDLRISSGKFTQPRKYGRDISYFSFSHDEDHLWAPYLQENYSELEIPPHNATGFAIDRLNDHGAIAMLHSLHCLAGIRRAVQQLGEGKTTLDLLKNNPHVPHCFDYLRQAILCYADDVFERPRREDGSLGGEIIEGAYDVRMCRDSNRLFDAGEKYGIWQKADLIRF